MIDEEALIAAAMKLMEALINPATGVREAKTISFSLRSDQGDDNGDWEIAVRPTRIPEGRMVRPSQITKQ